MKRFSTSNVVYAIVLLWSLSFLGGFAYGQEVPAPAPSPNEGGMTETTKPVACTVRPYDSIKTYLRNSHGEIGVVRFITDIGTGIEVFVNPVTGTSTVLEFIGEQKITCILGSGRGAQYNQEFFSPGKKTPSGILTTISS